MGDNTGIEWTHWPGFRAATWNPTVGCTRVSPGCQHCYAERWAWRMVQMAHGAGRRSHYEGTVQLVGGEPRWTGRINLAPEHVLERPLRTAAPTCYFVDSESDLFHDGVTKGTQRRVLAIMQACQQHRFLILTKRPVAMLSWAAAASAAPHIYLGVSAEQQEQLDAHRPYLNALVTFGWKTFLSYEPALGALTLPTPMLVSARARVAWVIAGAESGTPRRPCRVEWFTALREQCRMTDVPFFMKQGSAHRPGQQAGLPDALWATKEFPESADSARS